MAVRAVVFDVGGVLELSADDYPFGEWAARAGLSAEEFTERTHDVWTAGWSVPAFLDTGLGCQLTKLSIS